MLDKINYWSDLERDCPVDISRIMKYHKEFDSYLPEKIEIETINKAKEMCFSARGAFDSMVTTLIQLLHDKEILKAEEDKIVFGWIIDNLGRYMKRLDEQEEHLLVKFDEPEAKESRVGISRISAYVKVLRTATDTLIYESLLKATKEYNQVEEKGDVKRDKRTFLYILFLVINVTLSALGGITREKTGMTKRGVLQSAPLNIYGLMSQKGQQVIREGYKEETGVDMSEFSDIDAIEGELEDED